MRVHTAGLKRPEANPTIYPETVEKADTVFAKLLGKSISRRPYGSPILTLSEVTAQRDTIMRDVCSVPVTRPLMN